MRLRRSPMMLRNIMLVTKYRSMDPNQMQGQSQPTGKVIVVTILRIQNKQVGMSTNFPNPSIFYDGMRETWQSHLTNFQN